MTQPLTVAAVRAVLTALLVGASTAIATWGHSNDGKAIAIATATAMVSVLAARLGVEGAVDQSAHKPPPPALLDASGQPVKQP